MGDLRLFIFADHNQCEDHVKSILAILNSAVQPQLTGDLGTQMSHRTDELGHPSKSFTSNFHNWVSISKH